MSSNRPEVTGTHLGVYDVSQGASWSDLTAADFTTVTGRSLAAGDYFSDVLLRNTHATQSLRFLLRANAGEDFVGILVPAESTVSVRLYGQGVSTIAVRGSGAATTGQVVASFVRGGG